MRALCVIGMYGRVEDMHTLCLEDYANAAIVRGCAYLDCKALSPHQGRKRAVDASRVDAWIRDS